MPLESPQDIRNRLDAVTTKLLDGEISTNVAETARKLLSTAADTFKADAGTALAPVVPQAPAVSGAAPGGATFNITFATTSHGPVFTEAAPEPPLRVIDHPEPAPRAPAPLTQQTPPQIVDVTPTPVQKPPTTQRRERQQTTALLLAKHRSKK